MTVALVAMLLVAPVWQPSEARAFGTINDLGQRAEHERITRIALGCPEGTPSSGECFEPLSLDQLAGKDGTFGAVGAPDSDDQILDSDAHCDDADYLDVPGYPQSRAEATQVLQGCIDHLRDEFEDAIDEADDLLDGDGTIEAFEVVIEPSCVFTGGLPGRAKCEVLQGLGRALHGVQDFYSHSNWADEADPNQPTSINNPPGLNLPAPSPLLDLRSRAPVTPPQQLSTGFFKSAVPGEDVCPGEDGRITHACLNKDKALIEPGPGGLASVSDPLAPRGQVLNNEQKAVNGAILESRRQWDDFRAAVLEKYGQEHGTSILLALTKDSPPVGPDGSGSGAPAPPPPPVPGAPEVPSTNGVPAVPNAPGIPNIPGIPGLPRP